MVRLKYRLLPELSVDGILPLAVALIDYQDILDAGIDMPAACQAVANCIDGPVAINIIDPVSYTHLRAHETGRNLVCRLLLEKKKEI